MSLREEFLSNKWNKQQLFEKHLFVHNNSGNNHSKYMKMT
jgi:hypothetical protein